MLSYSLDLKSYLQIGIRYLKFSILVVQMWFGLVNPELPDIFVEMSNAQTEELEIRYSHSWD